MKAIIIEDEKHSAKGLARILKAIDETIEVVEFFDSIESTVHYFRKPRKIDLVFMDIQLSDGQCFEIFEQVEIAVPIIFTTSFNEYALKAFEVNSIDYLLKPILPEALAKSIAKFHNLKQVVQSGQIETLMNYINKPVGTIKNRFLVKAGSSLKPVEANDVAFFCIDDQLLFLHTFDGHRHLLNSTLEATVLQLSPMRFFRINRQSIVNKESVSRIHPYFNATLKLEMKVATQKEFIVSRSMVKEFKEWIEK